MALIKRKQTGDDYRRISDISDCDVYVRSDRELVYDDDDDVEMKCV